MAHSSNLILFLGVWSLASVGACDWPLAADNPALLGPQHLGVVINDGDRQSVEIGKYYQRRRQIPPQNLIHITLPPQRNNLTVAEFQSLEQTIKKQTPKRIQAYVLTWIAPYRVDCMSITSALALGFHPQYCAQGCAPTALSPYFNHSTHRPHQDLQIRPTIMLGAKTLAQAQQLIERGQASDGTAPLGTAYLLSTQDKARNVRAADYGLIRQQLGSRFPVQILWQDTLAHRQDVMFYFTGLAQVTQLETLQFPPGAIADHLTSLGGQLTDSPQMSSLRWLEAGATGSYGTVVEPCNFPQKFPHPGILMHFYLNGETLLESYWKSVAWPGQGVFIGEPLARPFGRKSPPPK